MIWDSISCWIESHPGLASWVQAAGAIAAIGIAIWIPYRQRAKEAEERANIRSELEMSRTEQLLAINNELEMIVTALPYEHAGADYNLTNEMSRSLFESLIERLNYFQREELSPERLTICLSIRIELYDWMKFFSEKDDHDGGALYRKSEKELVRIDVLKQKIENVKRGLRGEPLLAIVKPPPEEPDIPF
ncbi:hypothetical protein [Pseudomonas asplenii]|uniref:hypothetical protein n=1 Tax=Pseudomonas asplenii TaxID=53407 RepID=UPI0022341E4C|nr:hypothetical protein [Pseudomonas asplenii]UZE30275.1 hypothetical protein LOY63_05935 [Pseudomonas asplenii]